MTVPNISAKDYLSQAYKIDRRIDRKLELMQSLRDLVEKASSTLSDVPLKGSRNVHSMEDIICKLIDLESDLYSDLQLFIDLKREVMTLIKGVGNSEPHPKKWTQQNVGPTRIPDCGHTKGRGILNRGHEKGVK
jgi:hypothetical protein